MAPTHTSRRIVFVLMAWLAADPTIAADQDELGRAKTLYASAAYDEALAVLESLPNESSEGSTSEAAQYREICAQIIAFRSRCNHFTSVRLDFVHRRSDIYAGHGDRQP